jgi:hypothetical protein
MIPGLGFLSPFAPSDSDVISPGSRGSKRSRADANLDDDVFVRDEEIARRRALLLERDVARMGLPDPAREFVPAQLLPCLACLKKSLSGENPLTCRYDDGNACPACALQARSCVSLQDRADVHATLREYVRQMYGWAERDISARVVPAVPARGRRKRVPSHLTDEFAVVVLGIRRSLVQSARLLRLRGAREAVADSITVARRALDDVCTL